MMTTDKGQSALVIDNRVIGGDAPPYIVAEISANHNGSLQRALDTIAMAQAMGADAVKLQTYTPDTLTIDSDGEDFKITGGLWDGYTLYELYKEAHTPYEWHKELFEYAAQLGITCFSTPFDETAVDLLEDLNCPAYKIASFEAVDLPLIGYVARTGKPMIISTGMADLEEMQEAVAAAHENGCRSLALLHCISSYPAPVEESHLRTIPDLANRFGVVAGLSDHSLGTTVAITAVALGAAIIEKHVTLSRSDPGPDSSFSLEPEELRKLCDDTLIVWKALGHPNYERKPSERKNVQFRRSIYAVDDIKAGDTFTKINIRRVRPGYGLPAKFYNEILGKKAAVDIKKASALKYEYVKK